MKVAVLGVGLIGGSIGLAARSRTRARVVGYDPEASVLKRAVELGAIDEPVEEIAAAVRDVDFVFVAAPVRATADTARAALAAAGPQCIVSDVGSTKQAIVEAVSDSRFVGGHPLAGSETAGVEHAREDLFDGAAWYLTPAAQVPSANVGRLRELIAQLGARPSTIDADSHDRLMARVSHLPHVLANVLAIQVAEALARERDTRESTALEPGPSFRDATRVAGANTAIWTDIYLSNGVALLEAIDETVEQLGEVRTALAAADPAALTAWGQRARAERKRLLAPGPLPGA